MLNASTSAQGQIGGNQMQKGTAVDSVNASIESLANRVETLTRFAARISDGILGVEPPKPMANETGPRAVTQSTQEHLKDLEAAFERLSG